MKRPVIVGHIDLDNPNAKTVRKPWKELEKELTKSKKPVTSTCCMCGRTKYTSECMCEVDY